MKCCDISRGNLRHVLVLYNRRRIPDGGGGAGPEWDEAQDSEVRAQIIPVSGTEQLRAMHLEASVSHRIVTPFRIDISPDDKLTETRDGREREFNIKSVVNVEERDRWLEIMAQEGVAQ